jgi:hypothetical protein
VIDGRELFCLAPHLRAESRESLLRTCAVMSVFFNERCTPPIAPMTLLLPMGTSRSSGSARR